MKLALSANDSTIDIDNNKQIQQNLLQKINELGLKLSLKDLTKLLKEFSEHTGQKLDQRDCETLSESILYQYAYLEKLMKTCKDEKDPKGASQMLVRGKDPKYNS